jgi:hypothetical protein
MALVPEGRPGLLGGKLSDLGKLLEERFKRIGNKDDLRDAICMAEKAVESTPQDHPDLARRLNNLGSALQTRFDQTGNVPDLDEAVRKIDEPLKTHRHVEQ